MGGYCLAGRTAGRFGLWGALFAAAWVNACGVSDRHVQIREATDKKGIASSPDSGPGDAGVTRTSHPSSRPAPASGSGGTTGAAGARSHDGQDDAGAPPSDAGSACDAACSVPDSTDRRDGGTEQSDAGACVADVGQPCGSCGGTLQCDGGCSVSTPASYGQNCGSCGGSVTCSGSCSINAPSNYGMSCGRCGGSVACDGSCSVSTPTNYGESCGSCGGTVKCDGSCSVATPENYAEPCGCGSITCSGTCSSGASGTYGSACPSASGTAINVNQDYGDYNVQSITLLGAPPGIYTFSITSRTAGKVTLNKNGQAVWLLSYLYQNTVSGANTNPVQSYTFTFPGFLSVTIRAGSLYANGSLNLIALDASIFNGTDYISVCCH